ncbi:MAG TPA: chromate resistance protein ChrB domain-containing protein [Edaphobacter sp.]|jgi:hypothetical protein|nr:chromate resistance protein ChrB domain-containing protein [Edaphobacter sp.]
MVFTLPSSKASERVQIWRKLQRFGSMPFRNAGYMLPNTPENLERFEWLATAIRGHQGGASVLKIQSVDDPSETGLQDQFRQLREADYTALIKELQKLKPLVKGTSSQISRLKRRYEEIVAIDFFGSPLRKKAEGALSQAEHPKAKIEATEVKRVSKAEYQRRTWITRPRPGIDRVSSAWLILRFIDPKAKFIFDADAQAHPKAVSFDMFQGTGFGHEEDCCTFEVLCLSFGITDKKVLLIGQAIHDADLEDAKFGRVEGEIINQILKGWAKQAVPDDELLRRGTDLVEGLYNSIA